MDEKKILYLISLLYSEAEEDERKRLNQKFRQAILQTEEYKQIVKLLKTVTFFGYDGLAKKEECEDIIKRAVVDIKNVDDNIKLMAMLTQKINNDINYFKGLLESAAYFEEEITVIKTEDIENYRKFYHTLASSFCYYMLSQYGVKSIQNLTYNYQAGFREIVRLVNQQYSRELMHKATHGQNPCWSIERCAYRKNNFIDYTGYRLFYGKHSFEELCEKAQHGEYSRIAPYLFVTDNPQTEVLCAGRGNIVSVSAEEALTLLGTEIITVPPINVFGETDIEFCDLIGTLKKQLRSDSFCLEPEDLAIALDRWKLCRTVSLRKQEGKCIVCGAKMKSAGISCESHLAISE